LYFFPPLFPPSFLSRPDHREYAFGVPLFTGFHAMGADDRFILFLQPG